MVWLLFPSTLARKMVPVHEDKAIEAIDKTQKITRDGFAEVKRAIKALRPIMIEDSTLEEALEALFEIALTLNQKT